MLRRLVCLRSRERDRLFGVVVVVVVVLAMMTRVPIVDGMVTTKFGGLVCMLKMNK